MAASSSMIKIFAHHVLFKLLSDDMNAHLFVEKEFEYRIFSKQSYQFQNEYHFEQDAASKLLFNGKSNF